MHGIKTKESQSLPLNDRYVPGLDGLRAFAVLAVVIYHLKLNHFAQGGLIGVGIFFVLSGYLITDILITQWRNNRKIDLHDFWIKRARRLLPGLLFLLIAVVIGIIVSNPSRLADLWGDLLASLLYITNWWFIVSDASYFSHFTAPSPLLHLWSLAVEEQFYLIWPFLLALGLGVIRKQKWIVMLILLGAFISALAMALLYQPGLLDQSRIYYGTDTRAFALLIGAALAFYCPIQKIPEKIATSQSIRVGISLLGTGGFIALLWMILFTNEVDPFLYKGGMVLQCLATASLIMAIVYPSAKWFHRIWEWAPLKWLGIRSYGIYLWHFPVLAIPLPTILEGEEHSIIRAIIQISAIIIIAALSWKFIEKPIRYRHTKSHESILEDQKKITNIPSRPV
ncbi:Peptidoglycan/LPS O-acetylase OafA/YrhL, contains acyltransferase and SGNH-hydrolase domains [Thermoactinomyces sp. DSM 45891]|uniref:acyltransferase family protein n=1 Tax=Thermoactinomyces sp. DSM 45891 TaxID=1761907 RepID=UPI000920140A|nr:acyltransferase [Thermoactinomyces sp. DSM 45891]SFX01368.1 Peptidoglycan/LPS O-acetylase OafA/YrhL, contains acyltransferase and SGNH-hydrolase domains [Thermoactinomyces sp. DSM 45891]